MDKTRWYAQDMMAVCVRLLDLLLSPNTLHAGARGRRGSGPRRRRRAAGGAAATRQPHGLEQGAHAAHEQELDLPRHGQVCWCACTRCTILCWSALQQPACVLFAVGLHFACMQAGCRSLCMSETGLVHRSCMCSCVSLYIGLQAVAAPKRMSAIKQRKNRSAKRYVHCCMCEATSIARQSEAHAQTKQPAVQRG